MYNIKNRKILFLNAKRLLALALAICFLSFLSTSIFKAFAKGEKASSKLIVTDLLGRKVEIENKKNKRLVAIGPGALRLVLYVNGTNNIVGVENVEKVWEEGSRTYIMAYPQLKKIPTIGQGGADSSPDPEKLIAVKPDVIFAASFLDKAKADALQAKTKIPVVVLDYGTKLLFDENVYKSLRLIGKIVGRQQRAEDLINYMQRCKAFLNERTKNIPASKKPKVYVGAISFKGGHGFESTMGKYFPFLAINALNVADSSNKEGWFMVEKEKILEWDPDLIFIDEANLELVKQDYKKNPEFYKSLSAFKNGRVYGQLPYNFYWTNIDTVLADTFWIAKVVFPDRFRDVDPVKRADEVYKFFLGKPLYSKMAKKFGGFVKINLD
ncbi:periplasmic binding protein [Caldicellulosiruptor acetigenus I77R1B]|uniref:ABC-type transporter, periplasmic subunit n=2 Tax=Caldicellulosiruptor acetigenus TaxID=301953 RepID=G2PW56_9FIRM|nr:iron ABC transporter substrate-binding protein [Caldicellulosiruptor acetigenus]ADQ39820.1 periplasmic binding protein [Caldicellulosiruptor acetigenus I77R1B]AEM74657.1 ABC-type transporter, periplasmic subunit [Caldicellulosiruptor acetigenus 6A]